MDDQTRCVGDEGEGKAKRKILGIRGGLGGRPLFKRMGVDSGHEWA
jgi:hypothetical protein